ncbi:MAG: DUF2851 family protein [Daejeonella sp.]|uniref:DUF2851 family protein n=1 Tax=Daejeonella sp. TaxID=2805397 RepID=UPI0027375C33|nr:DUF2851 family protein [Daejeonella sp.]MDP3468391.1 DUF2851 family protein [Daejeonella sp.]
MIQNEDLLHYIWQFRLYHVPDLKSTTGESLEIIRPGQHNHHAGPDFSNAKIRIGDTLWAGNVEIHINSSDWYRHQHQLDRSYDNVILHVVAHHDQSIFRTDGTEITVLEIGNLIPEHIAQNYEELMSGLNWIPCEKKIKFVDELYINTCLTRVLIERLEAKSELIDLLLTELKGSWDDAFYIMLARNFGFKTNALPFEMLARSLPQSLLARYKDHPFQIEALIFGQAGFLNTKPKDQYPQLLRKEYRFLCKKHEMKPLDRYLWKYMRLRPRNFPSLRLAQFAALIIRSNHLFSKIIEEKEIGLIAARFNKLSLNEYWNTHYRFDQECKYSALSIGEETINNILINTISVFLFAFGVRTGSEIHRERGIMLLESLKPERNAIIRRFNKIGVNSCNSALSQALIQLKKSYCDQKKCLSCGIGIKFLNK